MEIARNTLHEGSSMNDDQNDGVNLWAIILALFGTFGLVVCIAMVAVFG